MSNITITSKQDDGSEVFMDSSIFPTLVITKRREWEKNPKGTRCYVQFNPLVTHSINRLTYRQFDYAIFMTFQRQLARWFHKRLSHNYTQAALMDPYHIRMSTIVRDSALVNAQRIRDQARYIEESLEELVEKNILLRYSMNVMAGNRKKIEDITYVLTPHPLFVSEITTANKRSSKLSQLALPPQQDPPRTPADFEK